NCHLKSKLGEFIKPQGAPYPPETVLTAYDAAGRAMGALRAALRRMGEAWVLRRAVLDELEQGRPVMVLGDFNDGEHAVSSEIISGETPFKNYAWMLRHDAQHPGDRYSDEEDAQIREAIDRVRLRSAEKMFLKKSLRDVVYTTAFGGVHESIDQIYMSRHFDPDWEGAVGGMHYYSVFNDHLTDGSHPEAPYNKLASDHGQIMAHMELNA
ncbi:MAG: alpha-1,4 polygalactosaminidase, partial [Leisingera sp.]